MIRHYIITHGLRALYEATVIASVAYVATTGLALVWGAFQ